MPYDRPFGDGLGKPKGLIDRGDDGVILAGEGRTLGKFEVPVLGMVQVGEAAVGEGAHKVERHRRAAIGFQQAFGVGTAGLRCELGGGDVIAAIAGQREAGAGLHRRRARLGVLPGEAPHADHRRLEPIDEHHAHLEQDLEAVGDDVGAALGEAFGAVAALEEEAQAVGRLGQLRAERLDLPRRDERRRGSQLGQHGLQDRRIRVVRLLQHLLGLPRSRAPVRCGGGDDRPIFNYF